MPNWCENNLTITGAEDRLRQFLTENIIQEGLETTLDFNFVAPLPADQKENWYEWQCANWGTKWKGGIYFVEHAQPDALTINFNSAWSPPEAWVEKASRHYPDLHFHLLYEEPGMDFGGYFIADNGVTEGECADLDKIDEETERPVKYDQGKDRYIFLDTGEVIEDEDYYPQQVNHFTESI